jgi:hypothetical protein
MSEPKRPSEVRAFAASVAVGLLEYMTKEEWKKLRELPDKLPQNIRYGSVLCETCKINCCITAFEYKIKEPEKDYPLGVKVFCWGCKEDQTTVPVKDLQQIRLASNQDLDAINELLRRAEKLDRVNELLSEPVQYCTPSVHKLDIKPFTRETWEKEMTLFDNEFAEKSTVNVYKNLTGKNKHDYHRINLYVTDQTFNEQNEPNSESILYQTMFQARKDEWEFAMFSREYHDYSDSTLLLIDQVGGNGSTAHEDWTQAKNILFGLYTTVRAYYNRYKFSLQKYSFCFSIRRLVF